MVWFLTGGPPTSLGPGVLYTLVVRSILEQRLPSLTLQAHCGSGGRPGVNSEERDASFVPSGLQDSVYNCRHGGPAFQAYTFNTVLFYYCTVLNTESNLHYFLPVISVIQIL